MKRQKNNTSKIIKIAFAGIGLLLAIPFCMGMYTGITSHSKTTGAITSVLKTHCNCSSVNIDHKAFGAQYSSNDGFSRNQVTYHLKDSAINTSLKAEAARLTRVLNNEVANLKELDVVTLVLENGSNKEAFKINNGILQ